MNRATRIWIVVMLMGGAGLVTRAALVGNGRVYVREVTTSVPEAGVVLTHTVRAAPRDLAQPGVRLSWPRTIGVWLAALSTLGILSFVVGDNPLYKLTESVFVGVSAAYLMVVAFWTEIVQNLLGQLVWAGLSLGGRFALPLEGLLRPIQQTLLPGLKLGEPDFTYIVPLILSGMLLWRLSPLGGGWIARWPLAFFIGATAGIRLIVHLEADFVQQINSTILPLAVFAADGSFAVWPTLKNITIMLGVLMGLTYFFFSVEHKGLVGVTARGGVWLLMITFGATFGYTVMGRVALLTGRLEFLFDDWLWLIDPLGQRL
jgi:hypothetical protein